MSNECLETLVVVSCKPISGITAETGSYTTQTVLVHIGFLAKIVNGSQVIFHALSGIITTDFFQPFHSETGKSAAIRSDDDISVGSHDLKIPANAPELADRTLRTTFAEEQSRIFFCCIEMRRVNNP